MPVHSYVTVWSHVKVPCGSEEPVRTGRRVLRGPRRRDRDRPRSRAIEEARPRPVRAARLRGLGRAARAGRGSRRALRPRRSCSRTAPARTATGPGSRRFSTSTRARATRADERQRPARHGRRPELVRLLLERGVDPNRGNDYGWTKLDQAGYSNVASSRSCSRRGGEPTSRRAATAGRRSGGALRGHREVVDVLAREPREPPGRGRARGLDLIRARRHAGGRRASRATGRTAAFRPQPSDDPQEVLDEALVWAAKSDRVGAREPLVELGASVDADPYRGTALTWAAAPAGSTRSDARRARRRPEPARRRSAAPTTARRDRAPPRGAGRTAEAVDTLLALGPTRPSATSSTAASGRLGRARLARRARGAARRSPRLGP